MRGLLQIYVVMAIFYGSDAFSLAKPTATGSTMLAMAREPPSKQSSPPMNDRAAELEAIGGDPFFLTDEEDEQEENLTPDDQDDSTASLSLSAEFLMAAAALSNESPVTRFVTDGLGPSPKTNAKTEAEKRGSTDDEWEWDARINSLPLAIATVPPMSTFRESKHFTRALSSSPRSQESNLSPEQEGMINFDEIIVIWYCLLALWYGYFAFCNWRRRRLRTSSPFLYPEYCFAAIHWFIFSIAIMGLANFLFSFGLLEALDHRSSIGGGVKKLSYANMILACLRHPCTLSLGVLAPRLAFSDSTTVLWLGSMSRGIQAVSSAGIQRTSMCLAALSCAQVAVRLTENLLILFRYGRRDASSVRLADFFEFVLDGIFLAWMMLNLYLVTHQISQDHGRRLVWSCSNKLAQFWILYAGFVVVLGIQSLVGILHYVVNIVSLTEHYIFTFYKINAVSDLVLLNGIAVLLRPVQEHSTYSILGDNYSGSAASYQYRDGHIIGGNPVEGETPDYSLLLIEEGEGRVDDEAEAQTSMEMTTYDPASHSRTNP